MTRKILVNILLSFITLPLFFFAKDLIIIDPKYYRHELDRTSFMDYFIVFFNHYIDPLIAFLFLILILLPFQLIKDWSYTKGVRLPLLIKCLIFAIIFMFYYALLARGYMSYIMSSSPMEYWGPVIGFGIFYPVVLYFLVDRYVEKRKSPDKEDEVPL